MFGIKAAGGQPATPANNTNQQPTTTMARQPLQEINATYLAERHRFEGNGGATVIASAVGKDDAGRPRNITIKGFVNGEPLVANQNYRFYGAWQAYRNPRTGVAENQFNFKTFVKHAPASRAGVVAYLKSLKLPGVGVAIAGQLFDKFGPDAVKVLRETPEVASAAISRLPLAKAEHAAQILEREKRTEDCKIELIELFAGRGFRLTLADDAITKWGNAAAVRVRKSPYSLMKFSGVGFKRADKIFLDLGGNPAAMKRQALCVWHAIKSLSNGDTWVTANAAEKSLRESIGGAEPNYTKALRLAIRAGLIAATWTDGPHGSPAWDGSFQWIAERGNARNERRIAEYVAAAVGESVMLADVDDAVLEGISEHQYDQLSKAACGCVGILGGSPGTGKTYTAAAYIKAVAAAIGLDAIAICAPTGKAAVRITEAMQANGVPTRAKTIHSLLKVAACDDGGGWSFQHGEGNPLPFRLIVVDESSMIDAALMAALLAARARDTAILFVGDVNQLPPVGSGAPLRDMIAAGVPYGELREIKRNDGGIVQACADIRDGKAFDCQGNLRHVPAATPEGVICSLLTVLDHIAATDDPVWGAQVLVAVNKKSPLARKEINRILQAKFNKSPEVAGSPFRLDDKVVCLKNSFLPAIGKTKAQLDSGEPLEEITTNEKGGVYVANGEIGRVIEVAPKYFDVALASPERFLCVPRGMVEPTEDSGNDEAEDNASDTGCNWDLAYGLSCHKSQGSEFPHVVTLIDEYAGAKRLCLREWWYTAISRAKKQAYLIGDLATARDGCRKQSIGRRKTFLKEWLVEKLSR